MHETTFRQYPVNCHHATIVSVTWANHGGPAPPLKNIIHINIVAPITITCPIICADVPLRNSALPRRNSFVPRRNLFMVPSDK